MKKDETTPLVFTTNVDDDDEEEVLFREDMAKQSMGERLKHVLIQFSPLGLIAFGGPAAHLGLLHERFVEKLKWLNDDLFLELISLGHALPGPTSTQVVTSIGILRGGPVGGILAFLLWMLPSFCVLTFAGVGAKNLTETRPDWMAGLAPAAIALVALAGFRLGKQVCRNDTIKTTLTAVSGALVLLTQDLGTWVFPIIMLMGGTITLLLSVTGMGLARTNAKSQAHFEENRIGISKLMGAFIIVSWFTTFVILSYLHSQGHFDDGLVALFYIFFRMGSIIFGGGQVILPMLLNDIVGSGWVNHQQFFAGFALVQCLPGPLFNFSAYLGAIVYGVPGAIVSALGIFSPGISLFFGLLPLWESVRKYQPLQEFLVGVNATAIGLILAAVVLLWEKAVHNHAQAAVVLLTLTAVGFYKLPSPVVIAGAGLVGFLLSPSVLNLAQQDFCVDQP